MNDISMVVHARYAWMSGYLRSLPARFSGEGTLVHSGRNDVRIIEYGGRHFAVKRFARNGMFRRIVYHFRKGKASRSYFNACRLMKLGVPTPAPVAFLEVTDAVRFVTDSYYICEYTDMSPIGDELNETGIFNRRLTSCFAYFVATLHKKGVLHHDLNSTNVLCRTDGDGYAFTLIDINRMKIAVHPARISHGEMLRNITRFSCRSEMFSFFLREYLCAMDMPLSVFARAMDIKERHDRRYDRKKTLAAVFRKIIFKNI